MPLETRNELFSMIGIDLSFVHGFPADPSNPLSQADLQAILHKSAAVLFANAAAAIVAAVARYFVAATNKSKWNRTGFGLGD